VLDSDPESASRADAEPPVIGAWQHQKHTADGTPVYSWRVDINSPWDLLEIFETFGESPITIDSPEWAQGYLRLTVHNLEEQH
jgi:hypothetical protein